MTQWTIAAAQYEDRECGIAENIVGHLRFIESAAGLGCNTLLFPELSLVGASHHKALPPPPEREMLSPLVSAASRYQMTIIVGLPLEVDGRRMPGVAVISPDAAAPLTLYQGRSTCLNQLAHRTIHFPVNVKEGEMDSQAALLATGTCTSEYQQQQSVQQLQQLAHKYTIAVLKSNYNNGSALWDENGQLIVRADAGELLLTGRKNDAGWEGDIIPLRKRPLHH